MHLLYLFLQLCERLEAISSYLKKAQSDLKPYFVKAIMNRKKKTIQIASEVEDFVKNDLIQKTCIDLLPADLNVQGFYLLTLHFYFKLTNFTTHV